MIRLWLILGNLTLCALVVGAIAVVFRRTPPVLWTVGIAVGVLLAVVCLGSAGIVVRQAVLGKSLRCPRCGAPGSFSGDSTRFVFDCTECGPLQAKILHDWRFSPSATMTRETGAFRRSTPCVSCGYDLRGLRGDGECPECGRPIEATTLQPLLATRNDAACRGPSPGRRLFMTAVAIMMTVLALMLVWFLVV